MKQLADTSCLVAVMIESHPAHERALDWYNRALARPHDLLVCSHSLAELYAVLTRLPLKPRIGADDARRLIRENVEAAVTIVDLDRSDYAAVLDGLAERADTGGIVYDALIVRAAEKAGAARIVTLNEADFRRLTSQGRPAVVSP